MSVRHHRERQAKATESMGGGLIEPSLIDEVSNKANETGEEFAGELHSERAHVDIEYGQDYAYPGTGREVPEPDATDPVEVRGLLNRYAEKPFKAAIPVTQQTDIGKFGTITMPGLFDRAYLLASRNERRRRIVVRNPALGAWYTSQLFVGDEVGMPGTLNVGSMVLVPGDEIVLYYKGDVYIRPALNYAFITYCTYVEELDETP